MKRLVILAIALAVAPLATAQLYKYVDKDGKTVYTDQPPPSGDSQQIKVQTAPTPGSAPAKSAVEREKDLDKSRAKAREDAKKADETERVAKENQERCEQAKANLQTYLDGGRISKYNKEGERVLMDDADIEAEREIGRASCRERVFRTV